jgi:glutaminyl-tRNA synthetase
MSKRKLRRLVEEGRVSGWDDPRMPTLCGLRRRGYTPSAIFDFVDRAGVAKAYSVVDIELLEHCIREELNATAPRRICVAKPVRLVVDNYPEGKTEYFDLPNNPQNPAAGTRKLPFTKELVIDSDDFAEVPPSKFFRLKPGGEVRLMGAYIVKFASLDKNPDGTVAAVHVTADLEAGNGNPLDGRKIKGTIHWLSKEHSKPIDLMLYDYLFTIENVDDIEEGKTYGDYLNVNSAEKITGALVEASLADAAPGERFQFVRNGYYVKDTKNPDTFNRIVGLKGKI